MHRPPGAGAAVLGMGKALPFGVLRRTHGMSGEITLAPFHAGGLALDGIALPVSVTLTQGQERLETLLTTCRRIHEGFLVRFVDRPTREAVADLVGRVVHLPQELCGELAEAEFFVEEVVGAEAVTTGGRPLGRVTGTFWNGAQDVMVVLGSDGADRFLPVVPAHVRGFDRATQRLLVDFDDE